MDPNDPEYEWVSPGVLNSGWRFKYLGRWWMPLRHQQIVGMHPTPYLKGWVVTGVHVPVDHIPEPGSAGGWFVPEGNTTRTFVFGTEIKIRAVAPPEHPDPTEEETPDGR